MKKILILFAALILTSGFIYSQGFEITSDVSPMTINRYGHALVSLPDGRVLAIGGHTEGFLLTRTAEIYDPQTDVWTLYDIDNPHDGCSYVELSDGKLMFFGGFGSAYGVSQSAGTTLFDPVTTEFTTGPPMNLQRAYSTAARLTDNRIIIVGNWYNSGDAEIYDPSTNTFTSLGIPISQRTYPLVFPCNDGSAVIISGSTTTGSPGFTDIVQFDSESMEFTSLASDLIADETGWTAFWQANSPQISEMKLSNGNYIFMMTRPVGYGDTQYGFAEFNPETKEVTKINSTPELPIYTGMSIAEWSYGTNIIKDPLTDYVYFVGTSYTETYELLTRLYSFDPSTGILQIPEGETIFDYYLSTSSKVWLNDAILCTGGSVNGSNFSLTNQAVLLTPQNSLDIEEFTKNASGIRVFPNPVLGGSFQINSLNHAIRVIDIIDLRGSVVKSIRVNPNDRNHVINRGNLSNGIYFLRMTGSKFVFTEKIIFH